MYLVIELQGVMEEPIPRAVMPRFTSFFILFLFRHSTRDDCWCAIHGKVYNVTSFLDDHPGGANIMVKYAGKDATQAFDQSAHPMVRK